MSLLLTIAVIVGAVYLAVFAFVGLVAYRRRPGAVAPTAEPDDLDGLFEDWPKPYRAGPHTLGERPPGGQS